MIAGVTIIAGTFNPPAAVQETNVNPAWPAAVSGWLKKRRPMQWNSLPDEAEAPVPFDDSPMVVSAADLWVADAGGKELWRGRRRISMSVEWPGIPLSATAIGVSDANGTVMKTPVTDGVANVLTQYEFQVRTFGIQLYENTPVEESEFSPYLNGQDYTGATPAIHADIKLVSRPGYTSPNDDIRFQRSSCSNIALAVFGPGDVVLKSWIVQPYYTTTDRMRSGAAAFPDIETSARKMRITNVAGVYSLLVPSGFSIVYSS